ncbi:MAG TPA: DedA family protein [Candidatus Saccharimonadales bacterium]|jgi:membrane-associated protein
MFGEGLTEFIITSGLLVIAATVFIECAFIFGFFLPGDSLLFLAGFIAGEGENNIFLTMLAIFIAAVVGNVVGYRIGERTGPKLFRKEEGIFFQKKYILQAQQFYAKHGGKTLILARFVPVMRTFAPLVAGIGNMPFGRFFLYSTVGAALWAVSIPLVGFYAYRILGEAIDIEKYVIPVVFAIMLLSIGGSLLHAVREGVKNKKRKKVDASELEASQAAADEQID